MSLTFEILGEPGRDNALAVHIDSGQASEHLLFDCGEGCLSGKSLGEIREFNPLFFSHFHMDHIGGFDSFFRCNFQRETCCNTIWGPPGSSAILQHRFQGFWWNLNAEMNGTWFVSEIHPNEIRTTRFELSEAFAVTHVAGTRPRESYLCSGTGYEVQAFTMDHRGPSIAYAVREKAKSNIDINRLADLGLKPGPWLKSLKDPNLADEFITLQGTRWPLADLRRQLMTETLGDSIAYLTDFLLDENAIQRLAKKLQGCKTLVCECQYRDSDRDLATRNYHMTTTLSATLARQIGVSDFVLFHLSDRYDKRVWNEMLDEARAIYPAARFPDHWKWNV